MENRIKAERAQAGITQESLAGKLKVSMPTISSWENGSGVIPSAKIVLMCTEIFFCSADWLLNLSSERSPRKSA